MSADADQHQPVAVRAPAGRPAGRPPARPPGRRPARRRRWPADVPPITGSQQGAGGRPAGEAEDVRAAQRVAGQRLEDRAGDAEREPGHQPGQRPRLTQVLDDEGRAGVAVAGEDGEHVAEAERVAADDDLDRHRRERAGHVRGDARDERTAGQHRGGGVPGDRDARARRDDDRIGAAAGHQLRLRRRTPSSRWLRAGSASCSGSRSGNAA